MKLPEYVIHVSKTSRVVWIHETPWALNDRILRPLTMAHRMKHVPRDAIRTAMKETGAVLALWTEEWDTGPCDWWFVVCDRKDYDLDKLSKRPRYDVRKGLEQCEVRRVDPIWFAENGYQVYAAAFRHYGMKPWLAEKEFVKVFLKHAEYPGRETWGAFIGDTFVAWESCIVVDDAVLSSSAKSDPTYFKARSNNALVYALTQHYLCERRFAYVNAGSRVLVHDTNVQEFQERMGYRKVYCPLHAELSPIASFISRLGLEKWGRYLGLEKFSSGAMNKLDALSAVVRISRNV